MTPPDDAGLVERLNSLAGAADAGFRPATAVIVRQAADRIETLKGEVEQPETEHREAWGALEKIAAMTPNRALAHLREAVRMVCAARSLSRPVAEEGR